MRIQILDDEGNVVNTIIATPDFAEAHYPGRWQIEPPPEPQE